jgi:hypothetical protein
MTRPRTGPALKLGVMAAAREQGRARSVFGRGAGGLLAMAALVAPLVAAAPAVPAAAAVPVSVSVVVPITARAGDDGMLDADTLEIATSPSGALTRELDEVLGTSATIALDPMILASIRVLGSAAPATALDWLDRLAAAPNEVFLLAYADADLTPLARSESLDLAAPLGFGFAIDPAAFGPAETAAPTASPTATPTPEPTETTDPGDDEPPPLPTTDELLAWPDAIGPIAWPSSGSATSADIPAYGAAGFEAVLLSSANVSETADALVDLGGLPGIVADSAASDLLREASTSIDDATRGQAITRLGAALDGLAAAHPGRSVVLTLDRRSSFSFYGLDDTYAALDARESTVMTGLSTVLAGSPEGASVVDAAPAPHVDAAPALTAAVRAEAEFATILVDAQLLTAPRRLQLLALLAVPDVSEPEWSRAADAFLKRSSEILQSVTIVDTGNVLVTSSQTSIPIRIANALDFAVTVRVDARPLRPSLQIDSPAEVTIEPGSSKTVRLDAQAITNGGVVVEVILSSPENGTRIGTPVRVDVDLQAQWETVGIVVGAVVAVVFAGGIARNVVVRRRRNAAERAAGGSSDPEDE